MFSPSRPSTLTLSTDASSRHIFEPSKLQGRLFDHLVSRKAKRSALLEQEPVHNQSELADAAENAIRPVALGRKNWIHFGSQEAGPRIAAILSIVETCRRLQLPIRDYLTAILPGLADLPVSRGAELTPTAWAARSLDPN